VFDSLIAAGRTGQQAMKGCLSLLQGIEDSSLEPRVDLDA
jgi:hypothetical protein